MLNKMWLGFMFLAVIFGAVTGHLDDVTASVTSAAQNAFTILIGLAGVMCFWLGMMRIAESAGLIEAIARLMRPIMVRLFPEVPGDHPAMGAMIMNMSANLLGLNNAATPFGLRAMENLAAINTSPGVASRAMCMFLAINTSHIQLIPATAIALLAQAGADHPAEIIFPTLLATACSMIIAIMATKIFEKIPFFFREETHD